MVILFGFGAPAHAQVQTGPAKVTATCYGNTCAGKDPNATGCSADMQSPAAYQYVDYEGSHDFLVRLSYSPACNASWTDIHEINSGDCTFSGEIWHEGITPAGVKSRTASVFDGYSCAVYTVMMSRVGKSVRACSHMSNTYCTRWL
ncbi:DUF2690 domain-containing protein [Nonomuraea sp. NPDC049784]|uniref:DUF2690 domain-containing protein n=1 Tax=Nonomuraea sp. NPDC049784 TaxID=3154361 RepID=UPI0033E384C7